MTTERRQSYETKTKRVPIFKRTLITPGIIFKAHQIMTIDRKIMIIDRKIITIDRKS